MLLSNFSYDIWGSPIAPTQDTSSQPFRYSGEYYDTTTGLQYLCSRWYDPQIGTYEGDITNPLSLLAAQYYRQKIIFGTMLM
ncbi:RHS repeat-associated core domain-containing protein [Paenibacillus silviterrae]|uniref:RHS repeat-associated core domain-containing protein n=1 Tax=Paenibacillus silviterrae TaxID=3242194 RepID=UPI00350E4C8B